MLCSSFAAQITQAGQNQFGKIYDWLMVEAWKGGYEPEWAEEFVQTQAKKVISVYYSYDDVFAIS